MHLVEKYALDCGVNPQNLIPPEVFSSYVTLGSKPLLVFSTTAEYAPSYPYFQDVVDEILESPLADEFELIQIGTKEDQILNGCKNLTGSLTISQLNYVLGSSSLYVGNISGYLSICDMASPATFSVCVYPEGSLHKTLGPFWNKHAHEAIVTKSGEHTKPEEILKKIYQQLGKEGDFSPMETVYIGDKYPKTTVDVVPDLAVSENFMKGQPVNIRFDFLENVERKHIVNALVSAEKRNVVFVTDKIFDLTLLEERRGTVNIAGFIFNIKKESSNSPEVLEFCAAVSRLGFKFIPAAIKNNFTKDEMDMLKLDFIDIAPIVEVDETSIESIDQSKINEDTVFRSSRVIFSDRKMFLSKQAFLEGAESRGSREQKLSEIKDLTKQAKELEYCIIINKK